MIKNQKQINFENDCSAIVDLKELEKAVLWYTARPVCSVKHIYMHGNYPAVSIGKEKIHIHRLLMMYWLKCVIPSEFYVHHIDENKLNATKENLSVVLGKTHQHYHNKGKHISNYQKKRIRESNHMRKGVRKNYKSKITAREVYELVSKGYSFNRISKLLSLDWGCVKQRYFDYIHDNPELLEDKPS